MLDKETQLVWQRTPTLATQLEGWPTAKALFMGLTVAGRRGWCLPSGTELASLADRSAAYGVLALPGGHPFQNVSLGYYWSATRYLTQMHQLPVTAVMVDFNIRGDGPISQY